MEDLAEVLAYHSLEAVELTRAWGGETSALERQALRFLVLAGDRASSLDPRQAVVGYERALELAPEGDPVRAEILASLGVVEFLRGRFGRSRDFLEEAIPALRAACRPARAAEVKGFLPIVMGTIAPADAHRRLLDEAIEELEELPPGKELVGAYAKRAGWDSSTGLNLEAIGWADKALSLSATLGLADDPWARICRGRARWWSGDSDGMDDIRRGIDLALEQGSILFAAYGHNDLGEALRVSTGPASALRELDEGVTLARRSGLIEAAESIEFGSRPSVLYSLGRWEELIDVTTAYLVEQHEDANPQVRLACQETVCGVLTWRGDLARASELSHVVHHAVRAFDDASFTAGGLSVVANLALAVGAVERAASVLHELEAYPSIREAWGYADSLPQNTRVALEAAGIQFAQQLATGVRESPLSRISLGMVEAQLAEALGEFDRAAELYRSAEEGWRTFSVPERAQSLLGRGRCLLAMGKPGAADPLRGAREVFGGLGAELYLPEVDALLEEAHAQGS